VRRSAEQQVDLENFSCLLVERMWRALRDEAERNPGNGETTNGREFSAINQDDAEEDISDDSGIIRPAAIKQDDAEEDSSNDSDIIGPDLSALFGELHPSVLAALQGHWAEKNGHAPVPVDVLMPPAPTQAGAPKQTALEETMGRLRLADSIALSTHELACQQTAATMAALALSPPASAVTTLLADGVVRLGDVLSAGTCDRARAAIVASLDEAISAGRDMTPGRGDGFGNFGTGFGFGNARMREQRWDMFLPATGGVFGALLEELLRGSEVGVESLPSPLSFDVASSCFILSFFSTVPTAPGKAWPALPRAAARRRRRR
jgi:hypothetical protein